MRYYLSALREGVRIYSCNIKWTRRYFIALTNFEISTMRYFNGGFLVRIKCTKFNGMSCWKFSHGQRAVTLYIRLILSIYFLIARQGYKISFNRVDIFEHKVSRLHIICPLLNVYTLFGLNVITRILIRNWFSTFLCTDTNNYIN